MKIWLRPALLKVAVCLLGCTLCGCATYHPHPLPTAPDLAGAPQLTVPARQFWLPGVAPHPIPPGGLDQTTVILLAVFNNPELKAARLQAGVASAQLLAAGLLPDPQFGAGYASSALNYGGALALNQDIQALITRGAARAAATAAQRQVNLTILWEEWQVAERARELFIQARSDDQLLLDLRAAYDLQSSRYHLDERAMQRGDVTVSIVSADLTALSDADASLRQVETEISLTRHQLNELLGLMPNVRLHLIGSTRTSFISPNQFKAAVAALPHRRPDLLALQAGYQSQEENLRRAILAQFPALSAGLEQARDPVEGVNSFGLNVNITLPLFNRNRGQIAIQRATRDVLRQSYQAQLDAAQSQSDQVWKATQILAAQLRDLNTQLLVLRQTSDAAKSSFYRGNLDVGLFATSQFNFLSKQAEEIRLRAALDIAQSGLQTILGLPFGMP
ncbi:MAG: TolC family protein [Acidobacteriaceae bacterium]